MVYKFREGSRYSGNAQAVGEEITRIANANGGVAPARAIVDAARPDDAPLHPYLTWNQEEAAEKCRLQEARQLTHSVYRVEVELDEAGKERAREYVGFASVRPTDSERGYMPTHLIVSDEELNQQMLNDAFVMLEGFKRRFDRLGELKEVFHAIDAAAARAKVDAERRAARQAKAAQAKKKAPVRQRVRA